MRNSFVKIGRLIAVVLLSSLTVDDVLAKTRHLTGEQIAAQLARSTITGINKFSSSFVYQINGDGSMTGVAEHQVGIFYDVGRWWIKQDLWCRQWELWDSAKVRCQRVFIAGKTIELVDEDGTPQEKGEISHEQR